MRLSNFSRFVSERRWAHKGYEVGYHADVVNGNWNAPKYWISRPDEDEWTFASSWTLEQARELIAADLQEA